ncbi:class II fumarate hydratase [Levilactobacillus bambusae]|uniref:Fumarate hydratase class II n=1 Tax=Levilactobacillus bambusae TaxID=2024736 RepID=A0A2V1MYZ6_9LACO|nr:class II fumarate hydratase [Levilactobacillus bambusae]PWG00187.1 class II fumarate hydratase [Levilactobacillus bambusae]
MTEYREESDTLGPVKIPVDAMWGPQTERSRQNFTAGSKMPIEMIRALLQIKKAAAQANLALGEMPEDKVNLIIQAIDQLLALSDEDLRKDFPLVVFQTGSGTQTNMNTNEVVAHVAAKINPAIEILPNDDVNHGQSSNDIFPTAMNITATLAVNQLKAAIAHMITALEEKEKAYWKVVKIGRTHLQDATPLTFGQEISGWVSMLQHDLDYLTSLEPTLYGLAIGGTAVGTGLNAAPHVSEKITETLSTVYGVPFSDKENKFYGLSAHSGLNTVHGAIKSLASDVMKIANDIRFLASGPRAGYNELNIPANEPGSSIMPGKVNPTQAEAITMAAARVLGNDVTISIAASQGNFEMNVYKPVLILAFLESANLLTDTITGFTDRLIAGLTVNQERMTELVDNSLMTVTALSPHIGYHDSAVIAQQAEKEGTTLKVAALKSGKVTEAQFDEWVDPLKMTNLGRDSLDD